mgnify:CR=1 FL=1
MHGVFNFKRTEKLNEEIIKITNMHTKSYPPILYFGTPVVLISTKNPDGTANLAPISSIFWLGWRCIIGLGASSQTAAAVFPDPVTGYPSRER